MDTKLGTAIDHAQEMFWYRKAAAQGYAMAESSLGDMYDDGHFVPRDYGQALYWYVQAAAQGDWKGQYGLGTLYLNGWGVTKDLAQARLWFQKSAADGFPSAQHFVDQIDAQSAAQQTPAAAQPTQPAPAAQQSSAQQGVCSGFQMASYDPTNTGTYYYYGAAWGRATLEEAEAAAHDALFRDGLHGTADMAQYGQYFPLAGQCEHPHGAVTGIIKYCGNGRDPCGNGSYMTFGVGYGETTEEAVSNAMADCGRYAGPAWAPCEVLSKW
jgi:hypothetical protein